jgi:hypothetical protein
LPEKGVVNVKVLDSDRGAGPERIVAPPASTCPVRLPVELTFPTKGDRDHKRN